MNARLDQEFVIPLMNEPGALAEIAAGLGRAGVNIQGLQVSTHGDFGTLRIVTSDARRAEDWLRSTGQRYRVREVITVLAPDEVGELARITQMLAASGINVEAAYASTPRDGFARLTFAVDDLHSARKILG